MVGETTPEAFRVVLFSGGRGSGALAELLAGDHRIQLTVAINGYDDGASTGEVRRFLGDSLGPSDFRKNASRFARLRRSCDSELIDFLDRRLPDDATIDNVRRLAHESAWPSASLRLNRFVAEYERLGRAFSFRDASVGNFVFAGGFLEVGRQFNAAVDDYSALMGLPSGLIENVTDGTNAFLIALGEDGSLLGSEEEIVDARRHNTVAEIFLVDRPIDDDRRADLQRLTPEGRREALAAASVHPRLNPRFPPVLGRADLIIYAPGTQHSSLFPSYLTEGLGQEIAANLDAVKLLVTNIQEDAEITGRSAVDLIDRAGYYLRDKGRLSIPTPFLVTHYLLNHPASAGAAKPYVPLGRLESLEDPRLVRVANYEAGSTGRHDAAKVLAPYIEGFLSRDRTGQRVAILLGETRSLNKISQTLLEMVRGGIRKAPNTLTVFHAAEADIDRTLQARLGFDVHRLTSSDDAGRDRELRAALAAGGFEYLVLFDSSGMYHGEDLAELAANLSPGRLDAVWGSRRLSVKDIEESYRLRYRDSAVQGTLSAIGSHVLSLQFLALFGRYVTDTLSGARAVRVKDALRVDCALTDKLVNQHLLAILLRRRAEILELPVQFFAISPDQVRRTTVSDGLRSIATAVRGRFRRTGA